MPPITEKCPCIYHFVPPSAPYILVYPPNSFDKSMPVGKAMAHHPCNCAKKTVLNKAYKYKRSTFKPIFKKGDARSYNNYRTIASITNTGKILLKIIHKRMENTTEREPPDNHEGFRKARGTREHIANMRWIMERQLKYRKEVHMCSIYYSKAFDCINHDLL